MSSQSTLRNLLFTAVIAPVIVACGGGGGGGPDMSNCSPKPSINSNPPKYATVGETYRYFTDASWVCLIAVCNSVDLDRGPAGTTVDDYTDTVEWTPQAAHVNKVFEFKIKTEKDSCGDRASQKWKVTVLPAPVITAFTTSHTQVNQGDDITLRAVFASGTGYITGYGKIQSGKTISLKNLGASGTYELIVRNGAGSEVREYITVEVLEPLSIAKFQVADSAITEGETTTLEWQVDGDFTTLVIDPLGAKYATGQITNLSPGTSTTYTLTATSALGNSVSASVHLDVIARPLIQAFTATPATASLNESVNIEASFTGGTAQVFEILETTEQSLMQSDFDISVASNPLTRNQRFKLVVTNDLGFAVTQTIEVPITGPGTFQLLPNDPKYRGGRYRANAVKLADGRVVLAGGYHGLVETFDPLTDTYSQGPSESERRERFAMTNMADGRVLITGGSYLWYGSYMTTRIYDPATDTLTRTTRLPDHAVNTREAILLNDGRILLYHQNGTSRSNLGEGVVLFDPLTETYTSAAPMNNGHLYPDIHLLEDGRVIFLDSQAPEASEIYDPVTDSFEIVGDTVVARGNFASAKLHDGRILIAGGGSDTAEIFDPATNTFRLLASPIDSATSRAAITLLDGRVLLAGGYRSALFDPATETFTETGGVLEYEGATPSLILLDDGRVLKFGGCSCPEEIYTP